MYLFLPSTHQEAFPFIPYAVVNQYRIAARQRNVIFSWWPMSPVAISDIKWAQFCASNYKWAQLFELAIAPI